MYQEILRNVERHAHATQVEAILDRQDNTLLLQVQDNGQGIAAEKIADPQSLGLFGLREEAAALGGEVHIHGVSGQGTTVLVTVPLRAP